MTVPSELLSVRRREQPYCVRFVVIGEVDAFTAVVLANALDGDIGTDRTIEVDLAGVSFIDGSGVRVLGEAVSHHRPGRVELHNPTRLVEHVCSLMGFDGAVLHDDAPRLSIQDRFRPFEIAPPQR